MGISVRAVTSQETLFDEILSLAKANARTLGFLPVGAFQQRAEDGMLLAAVDEGEHLLGYTIYRVNEQQRVAYITHLCVDEACRRGGAGRALIERLRERTGGLAGIRARCRRDYEASKFWPRVGFVPRATVPGRGRDGAELTVWCLDHGEPNLFTLAERAAPDARIPVVVDTNVLFHLQDSAPDGDDQCLALLADWLTAEIELYRTPEAFLDIDRNRDPQERQRRQSYAGGFPEVPAAQQQVSHMQNALRPLFPAMLSVQDASDLKHMSWALAGGAAYFVTTDASCCDMDADIYERWGMHVCRPHDLVVHIDASRHGTEYQPARYAGTDLRRRLLQAGEDVAAADRFHASGRREPKVCLRSILREAMADRVHQSVRVIAYEDDALVALWVVDTSDPEVLAIPLFRLAPDPISATLSRHLVSQIVRDSLAKGHRLVELTDEFSGPDVAAALVDNGFVLGGGRWLKTNAMGIRSVVSVADELEASMRQHPSRSEVLAQMVRLLRRASHSPDAEAWAEVERALWPVKLREAELPAYIVPIKPHWAAALFDEEIRAGMLFGSRPDLLFSYENAYYSGASITIERPARVLWYVSEDKGCPHAKAIRACSLIEEVAVGTPKQVFSQFRRLGVYGFKDVLAMTHDGYEGRVVGMRFAGTELLPCPISFETMQETRMRMDKRGNTPMAPTRVSQACFEELYALGTGYTLEEDA